MASIGDAKEAIFSFVPMRLCDVSVEDMSDEDLRYLSFSGREMGFVLGMTYDGSLVGKAVLGEIARRKAERERKAFEEVAEAGQTKQRRRV